jgi:glycosyltransferase involved in cell wall biosynthesis
VILKVTAVIPAYNEAPRIGVTVRDVSPYVEEVLVIDDGSQDHSAREAEEAGARVISHPTSRGYIQAIKTGFQEAAGEVVVTVDGDGEFPAAKIPDLVKPVISGEADMVQGVRDYVPRPSERFLTLVASMKAPVGDSGTGLRALRTDLARKLVLKGACICGIFSLEVIHKGGRIAEIPIRLEAIDKPRRIAWYHLRQLFYLLPWLVKRYH